MDSGLTFPSTAWERGASEVAGAGPAGGRGLRPPPTVSLPLLQIFELNERMSAVERLLTHLENIVVPPEAKVMPRARQVPARQGERAPKPLHQEG